MHTRTARMRTVSFRDNTTLLGSNTTQTEVSYQETTGFNLKMATTGDISITAFPNLSLMIRSSGE